ncbi:hypothetical protein LMG28690_04301 [Paraburkholderia caffeinilytica]|nr:hypothetical protein LMG28690_04301 [Paraburkholderia caffeinilytica]
MLKNAWAGQERLWKVWWGLGIPLICITFLINAYLAHVPRCHQAPRSRWLSVSFGSRCSRPGIALHGCARVT